MQNSLWENWLGLLKKKKINVKNLKSEKFQIKRD